MASHWDTNYRVNTLWCCKTSPLQHLFTGCGPVSARTRALDGPLHAAYTIALERPANTTYSHITPSRELLCNHEYKMNALDLNVHRPTAEWTNLAVAFSPRSIQNSVWSTTRIIFPVCWHFKDTVWSVISLPVRALQRERVYCSRKLLSVYLLASLFYLIKKKYVPLFAPLCYQSAGHQGGQLIHTSEAHAYSTLSTTSISNEDWCPTTTLSTLVVFNAKEKRSAHCIIPELSKQSIFVDNQ